MQKKMNWKLQTGDTIGIVCCSDGHELARKRTNAILQHTMETFGLQTVWSPYIYARENVFSASGKERAEVLNDFYGDPKIKMIFDISGGNVGNGILEHLDYDRIGQTSKLFVGYSDLTTVHHAIYTQTGNGGCLYQLRNLIAQEKALQQKRFRETFLEEGNTLFSASYTFLRGERIQGTVIGGNLRCLLKLAGTPYWPNFRDSVLFLEALGGGVGEITAMLTQLRQIGVFSQITGLLLGTFTKMDNDQCEPTVSELIQRITADYDFPIAKTVEIGHGANSKALMIGSYICITK